MNNRFLWYISLCSLYAVSVTAQHAPDDIRWKKLVSREIEMPAPTVNAHNNDAKGSRSLVELMVDAIGNKNVVAYSNTDINLTTPVNDYEYKIIMNQYADTQEITDPLTQEVIRKIIKRVIDYKAIHIYRVLEEWTFNPVSFKTEIQLLGIAPVREQYNDDGSIRGKQAMCWLRYEDALPIINKYDHMHSGYSMLQLAWDDYFSESGKPVIQNDIWHGAASRILTLPITKEDPVEHHLRVESADKTLFDEILYAKYTGSIPFYKKRGTGLLAAREYSDPALEKKDTEVITDPLTNQEITTVIRSLYSPQANTVELVEQWAFDPVKGKIDVEISDFSFLGEVARNAKGDGKKKPMFWLHFKDIANMLAKYDEHNPNNNFASALWNNYFLSEIKPLFIKE